MTTARISTHDITMGEALLRGLSDAQILELLLSAPCCTVEVATSLFYRALHTKRTNACIARDHLRHEEVPQPERSSFRLKLGQYRRNLLPS